MKEFLRNEKGEFTVEATIVFTISFCCLILFLYVGIVMYQHVHLQSITDRIASRGAMMYATRTTDMSNGYKAKSAFWDCDPYRYIFDGGYKAQAQGSIKSSLDQALGKGNVISNPKANTCDASVELGLFTRKVKVVGKRSFDVPFVSVFQVDNSMFDIEVMSSAYIMDMPETIRNVDFACDLINRNEAASKAIEKVSGLKNKLESFIEKIK